MVFLGDKEPGWSLISLSNQEDLCTAKIPQIEQDQALAMMPSVPSPPLS